MKKALTVTFVLLALSSASLFASNLASSSRNATYYRLLSDAGSIRSFDKVRKPYGFHVAAVQNGNDLQWVARVEGRGKLCTGGSDWLNLNDGRIHSGASDVKPNGPYIQGCAATNGTFTPSSTEVLVP
jgi:hypothetical protein